MKLNIIIKQLVSVFQVSNSKIANHLYSKGFGTLKAAKASSEGEQVLIIDPLEVLYIYTHKKNVSLENFQIVDDCEFLSRFLIPYANYLVYEDLRKKGYFVKQALKFGAQFRIYDTTSKSLNEYQSHATHLVIVCDNSKHFSSEELFSLNRVAHSTRKKILLAYVDYELSIAYIELSKWH